MNKTDYAKYSAMNPIASQCVCNMASIDIITIEYGIDDYAIVCGYVGDLHRYKIKYNTAGRAYFTYQNGCRYFLDEFMRVA